MTDLGTLGGLWSEAVGVNGRGEVIGISETPEGEVHAFFWTEGRMQDLNFMIQWQRAPDFDIGGLPRAVPELFDVRSINENGWIVGCGLVFDDGYAHGFVLVPGDDRAEMPYEAIDLGALPGAQGSLPYCINDDNVVVGISGNLAFQWERGDMIALDQFTRTVLFESRATGISDLGLAVGWYAEGGPSAPHEACMWMGGTHVTLGAGGGVYSEAAGVNSRDQIVGWSLMEGGFAAVMWEGRTPIDLNDVTAIPVRPPNGSGWFPWARLVSATALDERSWIAGYGQATDGRLRAFVLKPIQLVPAS
jgi:probable HAF family extracellular repeat protein